jgi:hypothetical protein
MSTERGLVMAKPKMRAAGFWPRHTVRVATWVLPRSTRDRYRQEFLAELYGLGRTRQLRHAAAVLSRSWALRAAINTHPTPPPPTWRSSFPAGDAVRFTAG